METKIKELKSMILEPEAHSILTQDPPESSQENKITFI
jgi:hypothetical protein